MHENSIDRSDFMRLFLEMSAEINLDEVDGFLYGSLFDSAPDLLAWVAERVPLIGNAPNILRQAKGFSFFKLLDDLGIPHPRVRLTLPKADGNWLAKTLGGSGGLHIRPTNQADLHLIKSSDYFQEKIAGTPVSMLFVANGKTAQTIGFNQQLVAPTVEMPYRFAGAVSNALIKPDIHAAFEHAAQHLTYAFNLRGLNNLDAILDGEKLWILELNPRLSASFHLYENLFSLHLQGVAGDLTIYEAHENARAALIIYADDAINIPADFTWPDWTADIPSAEVGEPGVKITPNAPICSVLASAVNARMAQKLVQQRAEKLRNMLKNSG
jgi:predicted ATP-grasp superfamily ATP-dependent carboligase